MNVAPVISLYTKASDTDSQEFIPLDIFLDNIATGTYQDLVLPVRAIADKKMRDIAKKKLPNVTISGLYSKRNDADCKSHSGFIGIDIDGLDGGAEYVKEILSSDPHVYAVFQSVSGRGLCVIFKIDGTRHREAFYGIGDYLITRYHQPIDPTSVNPSRARFVSYDPHLYINEQALSFKKYAAKEKRRKKVSTIFIDAEFREIVRQMVERRVSCVETYKDWIRVGFGIANQYGEDGRAIFHDLSAISPKYDRENCDRQYDLCLRDAPDYKGEKAAIATIYFFAKEAGIEIHSAVTRKVAAAAVSGKKAGLSAETIIQNLEKFEGISPNDSTQVVSDAYNSGVDYDKAETIVDGLLMWLRHNYDLRRNLVTRCIENNCISIDDIELNSIFLEGLKVFPELKFDLFKRCLFSKNTSMFHPFKDWYQLHKDTPYNNEIERLWSCIETDDPDKLSDFGTRWLVSIISAIHGTHSPLIFVLAGEVHGKGKTQFFRRLLPPEWRFPVDYYAESSLTSGKDDQILMCKKLLIMDDEFEGKDRTAEKKLKALTDYDTFDIREPYGHTSVNMKRLAVLGGTANNLNLLKDSTGNRRVIPILITGIDWETMNHIDRTALFVELFRRYHAGYEWRVLASDMDRLNASSEKFIDFSMEYELINEQFYVPAPDALSVELTASEIKTKIEARTNQRTNLNKIGQELKRLGFAQDIKRINGKIARVYTVSERSSLDGPKYTHKGPDIPDLPF